MKRSFTTLVALIAVLSFAGCFGRGSYTPAPTKVYTQPATSAGVSCAQQCKMIKIQDMQLAQQEYSTALAEKKNKCYEYIGIKAINQCKRNQAIYGSGGMEKVSYDLAKLRIEREYDACFKECGGKISHK